MTSVQRITRIISNTAVKSILFSLMMVAFAVTTVGQVNAQQAEPIVVDHTSIELFNQIPPEYLEAARNIDMVYSDRSVGQNVNEALDCLAQNPFNFHPSNNPEGSTNSCRRYVNENGNIVSYRFDVNNDGVISQAEIDQIPDAIGFLPDTDKYNRSNWEFVYNAGDWVSIVDHFTNTLVPSYVADHDVISYQFSYLNVDAGSDIADQNEGFFVDLPRDYYGSSRDRYDISDIEDFETNNPDKTFIYWTSSLARSIGTPEATAFNQQTRDYAIANNKVLFDFADIESHDIDGNLCVDNVTGQYPAICQIYTTEVDGGHIGLSKARFGMAYWVLMAQIAGWDPDGPSEPPVNQAPIVDAGADMTVYVSQPALLDATVTDDGLPNNNLSYDWTQVSGPATAIIASPNSVDSQVSFPVVGEYVLQLEVTDGEYTVSDQLVVTVTEAPANVAPAVTDSSVTTEQNQPIVIDLEYTDGDGPGPYTAALVDQPSSGSAVLNPDESVTYTPNLDFVGTDSFSWNVSDGEDTSATATVTVTVEEPVVVDPSDPVAYWPFDNDSVDEVISGCPSCLNFGANFISNGIVNGAYSFAANSYIYAPSMLDYLAGNNETTVSVWVNPSFEETDSSWHYVYNAGTASRMFYLGQLGTFRYAVRTDSGEIRVDASGLNWDANTWHHMVLTYDGAELKAYWDGQLVGSKLGTGAIINQASDQTYIGVSPVLNQGFEGAIDELKIFDHAMTGEEVLNLYNE